MNKLRSILLVLTSVAALSLAYPASVQADTTYVYTGNPFTSASGSYSTSDFVTVMVTLASPLAANMPAAFVFPLAFSVSDGVQTITNINGGGDFRFMTGPTGQITQWFVNVHMSTIGTIETRNLVGVELDRGVMGGGAELAENHGAPGTWTIEIPTVPDTGSTVSLMTLTLMALGVAARQFKRAAA